MPGMPIRVLLNDRALYRARTGVGHYIAELITALPEQDRDLELLPFYQAYVARWRKSGGNPPAGAAAPSSPRWRWLLRFAAQDLYHVALETVGQMRGCDLYHEPNYIPGPWPGPVVTTVFDLSVLRNPSWHPADRVAWYERDFLPALPRSHHFITISQFSKQEMIELLGIAPDRITSIGLGPRAIFHPRPDDEVRAWLAGHHLPADYLLFVGTIEPRKNVGGLLDAYARLPTASRRRTPLLVAGMSGWGEERIESLIRRHGLDGQVRVLGYLSDEALAYLSAGARALVWPTFYEGFGLPPLECMASGTPVIVSNTTALPELVGDAGLMVDPRRPDEIAEAVQSILEDAALAADLRERGLARSRAYTWARCAADHAAVYRSLVRE